MSLHEDEDFDQRLREAFEPEGAAVNRVVAAALSARPPMLSALRLSIAAGLIVALAAGWLLWPRPPAVRAESVRLEYIGNVALFVSADGSSWLVSADASNRDSKTPLNLIIVEGDHP